MWWTWVMSVRCTWCKSVCDLYVCMWWWEGVGFNSCYILWQLSDDVFRSAQKMWLTHCCSPQPQCQLHFLKPVLQLHATSLLCCHLFEPNDTILHHSIFTQEQPSSTLCRRKWWSCAELRQKQSSSEKHPHFFQQKCPQSPEESEGQTCPMDNEWLPRHHRCITVCCGTD